jgi:hypothetical protein
MKKQMCILSFMLAIVSTNIIGSSVSLVNEPQKQSISKNSTFDELSLFDITNEQSKWVFIEKKFITDVYAATKMTWSHLLATIPAAFAGFAGYKYMTIADQKKEDDTIKNLLKMDNIYLVGGTLAAGMVAAQYLDSYLIAQANRTALTNFFDNWDKNKFYVPVDLLPYFTMIAQRIENQGLDIVLQDAKKIVDDIKFKVTRQLESRYKKLLEFEAYNSTSDAKTVSEIFKNFIGGAKDLAA